MMVPLMAGGDHHHQQRAAPADSSSITSANCYLPAPPPPNSSGRLDSMNLRVALPHATTHRCGHPAQADPGNTPTVVGGQRGDRFPQRPALSLSIKLVSVLAAVLPSWLSVSDPARTAPTSTCCPTATSSYARFRNRCRDGGAPFSWPPARSGRLAGRHPLAGGRPESNHRTGHRRQQRPFDGRTGRSGKRGTARNATPPRGEFTQIASPWRATAKAVATASRTAPPLVGRRRRQIDAGSSGRCRPSGEPVGHRVLGAARALKSLVLVARYDVAPSAGQTCYSSGSRAVVAASASAAAMPRRTARSSASGAASRSGRGCRRRW